MSNIVKGTTFDQVSQDVLTAVADSIKTKLHENVTQGHSPKDWNDLCEMFNKNEAFKELIHNHAHALIEHGPDCASFMAGISVAIAWGLEICQAVYESTELNKLLVN